jgi:iron(III) transport system permease protein
VAAAALAVILGGALAAALVLTDLPGRNLWATALLVPFLCPPTVWALGQVYCYGAGGLVERGLGGSWRAVYACRGPGNYLPTVLVLAQIHAPLAMLIVGRGLARVQHAGFDAARLFLTPWRLAAWLARAVRQEAAAAFLLALALGLGNFAVPHVLQCRLYPIEVYARLTNYLDRTGAAWASLPLLAVTLAAVAGIALAERGVPYASAGPARPRQPLRLGRKVWAVAGVLVVYVGLTSLLPVAAMVRECKSPALLVETVGDAAEETGNSLAIAAGAALAAGLAGLLVGVWASARGRLAVGVLSILPLGVPALILGLAYVRFYNRTWPLDLSAIGGTSVLVVLGLAARGWPFVTRAVASGHRRIARGWHDAARVAGLRGAGRWRWIAGPLLADPLAAGMVVAFVLAVGDVEISQMLCAPGTGTLSLRLFTFLHFGPTHVAAGLALLQLTLAVVPVVAYLVLANRYLEVV